MKAILTGLILLMATSAWAGVTGTILNYAQDENGNIVVQTQYHIDGVEVPSRYPQDAQGRYYWQTRYSFQNFDGMDAKQIEARIKQDVDAFAQSLIVRKFTEGQNKKLDLSPIVGKSFTSETADIQISETKALTVSTDGTVVNKTLVPPVKEKPITQQIDEVKAAVAEVKKDTEAIKVAPKAIEEAIQ